jgi:putative hemolysin
MKTTILLDGIRPPRRSVEAEPVLVRSRDTKSANANQRNRCAELSGRGSKAPNKRPCPLTLSFLYHYSRAPEEWLVSAHSSLKVEINMMPKERVDVKEALKVMLPLIKDYLRLGSYAGAVVDRQFGTTDVLIVLPVPAIDARCFSHLGERDEFPPHPGSRRAGKGR